MPQLAPITGAVAQAEPPTVEATDTIHVVRNGDSLWHIAIRFATSVEAIVQGNHLANPDLIQVGQRLLIPGDPGSAAPLVPQQHDTILAGPTRATPDPGYSDILQAHAHSYHATPQANIGMVSTPGVGNRLTVVPSPIYANGIYARDAFYTVVGLDDLSVSEQAYRWFEEAQNPPSGQITTAIPFDPSDKSLQPQDDETTLLFLIWSGILHREQRTVKQEIVSLGIVQPGRTDYGWNVLIVPALQWSGLIR